MLDLWNYECLQLAFFMALNEPPQQARWRGAGRREAEIAALSAAVRVRSRFTERWVNKAAVPRLRTGTILGNPNTLFSLLTSR